MLLANRLSGGLLVLGSGLMLGPGLVLGSGLVLGTIGQQTFFKDRVSIRVRDTVPLANKLSANPHNNKSDNTNKESGKQQKLRHKMKAYKAKTNNKMN